MKLTNTKLPHVAQRPNKLARGMTATLERSRRSRQYNPNKMCSDVTCTLAVKGTTDTLARLALWWTEKVPCPCCGCKCRGKLRLRKKDHWRLDELRKHRDERLKRA